MSRSGKSLRGADEALRRVLEDVRARCDVDARKAADPVHFVHRYARRDDQEIVAMIASALAFGNVKALCAKIEDALARLGPRVAEIADDPAAVRARLAGFRHRVYRDEDLAGLVIGTRAVQRAHGSLGKALTDKLAVSGNLREALGAWVREIRERGELGVGAGGRRGAEHILPDPSKGSAVKRILLLVRWMARPADGVDLGLWDVPTSRLIIPVDTHIHKLSRNLGLTERASADFRAAEEITAALARLDPDDPVKYDFSLCHMGMLQTCPSKRDPEACEGCGVKPVCRHWRRDVRRRS
ncbi:MAG TPA: TIGR02757 family protein [Polyangium sp.]|nr:TIGR02757 family protein [Polyangium sp.]